MYLYTYSQSNIQNYHILMKHVLSKCIQYYKNTHIHVLIYTQNRLESNDMAAWKSRSIETDLECRFK